MSELKDDQDVDKGLEAFMREARELYDRMMNRAGGTDVFDDIEEQGEAAGRKLALRMLQDRLSAELKAQSAGVLCEKCGRPMRLTNQSSERNLQTASGTVRYERPHAICDRCEASFSPSGPAAEHSPARRVGAMDAQGLPGESGRLVSEGGATVGGVGRNPRQRKAGATGHRARRAPPGR